MAISSGRISTLWKARTLFAHPSKLFQIFRDKRTPLVAKILPFLALAYVLFPLDILPDFIPIIGQIDDLTVVLYILSTALNKVPDEVFRSVGLEMPKVRDVE
jgi:uncharacterized membrane protein YkvA (DUF1232 family)